MKKQESAVDKDFRKLGRVARVAIAFGLGILMLWLPTFIHTDIGLVNIAKGLIMFFGLLFLFFSLSGLWLIVTGKPLLMQKGIEEIMKEE